MDHDPTGRHTFVLRVWTEAAAPDRPDGAWRGEVVHVASGRRRFVASWEDVEAFVRRLLAASTTDAPGP